MNIWAKILKFLRWLSGHKKPAEAARWSRPIGESDADAKARSEAAGRSRDGF